MTTLNQIIDAHSRDLTKVIHKTIPALEARIAELERRLSVRAPASTPPAIDPLMTVESDAEFEDVGEDG